MLLTLPLHVDAASEARAFRFTRLDQIAQLVDASEADADLGFMARMMLLCSVPRANPGDRLQFKRVNGPYTLVMFSSGETKLPYGNIPRLLLAWVCTEAVRTQSRVLTLGDSLSEFMRKVGVYSTSGGTTGGRTRLRNQMKRLFRCQIELIHKHEHGERSVASRIADSTELWWSERKPDERSLWESKVELGEKFFQEIIAHPQGAQAVAARPRPVLLADLPDVRAQDSAAPFVAAGVPAVRRGPGQGWRCAHRGQLPHGLSAGVEENQDGLASPALPDGEGGIGALALAVAHPPVATAARGIAAAGRHKRPSCQHAGMRRLRA